MKVASCKTVRRQIDELNVGQELSALAGGHVEGCRNCRAFYETRHSLRSMLADLEPVEAPRDFNYRVHARLASRTAEPHSTSLFVLKSFSIPAVAVASLAFLLGAGLFLRAWVNTGDENIAATSRTTPAVQTDGAGSGSLAGSKQKGLEEKPETVTPPKTDERATPPAIVSPRRIRTSQLLASQRSNNQIATKEFSTTAAPVVTKDPALTNVEHSPVFAVHQTSSGPLKVSMDFDTGVSRTISLPPLSFGSERAFTGEASVIKTSSKGVW